ncbi:hypothetical protein GGH13_009749, partial [Coemansia sp. S155-1]
MRLHVVHADERQPMHGGQRLCCRHAHAQAGGHAWPSRHSHGVNVGYAQLGPLQRLAQHQRQVRLVVRRRQPWHDPAVCRVHAVLVPVGLAHHSPVARHHRRRR